MAAQGRYHGQRLKAKEVLRLYAAGERDFRGTVLRGCNFQRADLSGTDFSGADIRSVRFVDAILKESLFCQTKSGSLSKWTFLHYIITCSISILIGLFQGYSGSWIGFYMVGSLRSNVFSTMNIIFTLLSLIFFLRKGTSIKSLIIVLIFACAAVIFSAIPFSQFLFSIDFAHVIPFLILIFAAIAEAVLSYKSILLNSFFVALGVLLFISSGSLAVTVSINGSRDLGLIPGTHFIVAFIALIVASLLLIFSVRVRQYIDQDDSRFRNLRIISLTLATLGGTTFSGADLTDANFAHAHLKSTNFADSRQRPTTLTRVRWHHAQKLDRARLGTSNLQDRRVRQLLTTLNGTDQDFVKADLREANLAGAQLHRANLKGANLNRATLTNSELQGANLTEGQCVGTDFTAAQFTGTCLEAWNIDSTTVLKNIDCQFVYLLEQPDSRGSRERRPHNPDKIFQPGDFEKFFKEMLDTVQILIRNGVNPAAFRNAFETVMAENPDITRDSIQAMEKQGTDVLLTLQVPEGTDKAQVERTWDEGYQLGLKAGYTSGLLEGQTQRAEDVKEVALGFSKFLSSFQINNMNNPINTGDGSFYAGGDVNLSGSTINLGEISGQVSNQINQLADAPANSDQPNLKDLLTQLQQAVETDAELNDDEKAEALAEVAKLAKAGSSPKESAMQRLAKRATTTLKGFTETLTDASKLATACKTLLPLIASLFAL